MVSTDEETSMTPNQKVSSNGRLIKTAFHLTMSIR
jgi:hypothetical protein